MSDRATVLPDHEARRAAVTDFTTNLVVEAGAGTGKTSLLVERLLNAIGSGFVDSGRFAAITFTEKASGEMRQRVAEGLELLRRLARGEVPPDPANEAGRAFAWLTGAGGVAPADVERHMLAALEGLDRARVSTIHAFCSELLREHPVEAGIDPDFAIDEGEQAFALSREAWEEFVARELGPGAARPAAWRELLGRFRLAAIGEIARELAGFAVPRETLAPPLSPAADRELLALVAGRQVAATDSFLERAGGLTALTEGCFRALRAAYVELRDHGLDAFLRHLDGNAATRLDKDGAPGPNKKLCGVDPAEYRALNRSLVRLAKALRDTDDAALTQLLETVAPFVEPFRERFLERGVVSFDGLLVLARDLLRDHPSVRESLKQRYRMLLVDEFQDTDPLQYEIVLFLAERTGEAVAQPFEARLAPGRLFVVGDPKQSIYRFRGADFTAYRSAVGRIVEEGGRELDLTANFRSVPAVVDAANLAFQGSGTSWRASAQQPGYTAIHAVRPGGTDDEPSVELWTLDLPPRTAADERRRCEARHVAEEIERLVDSGAARYEEIAILFRAFASISLYLRPLREREIPFSVDGGRDFLKRPEVAQLMATLRTLAQPADPTALLAFLRSPAGGVPDTQLAAFRAAGHAWDRRSAVDEHEFPLVASRLRLLQELEQETRGLPADAVIRAVVERLEMLPLGAAAWEGAQRVANLRKLAAAAGDLARDGRLSLEEVVEALAEGRLADIQTDSPLADDRTDAVRITSIHRMKGLESRWVFLPDLARQRGSGRGPRPFALLHVPGRRPTPALAVGGVRSSSHALFEFEERAHDEAEELRVLYVALTRARDRLVLINGNAEQGQPWVRALEPWGYDARSTPQDGVRLAGGAVLHRRLGRGEAARRPPAPVERVALPSRSRYERVTALLRERDRPTFRAPSGVGEDSDTARVTPGDGALRFVPRASRESGKAVGRAVHRWLEGFRGDPAERLDARLDGLCRAACREEQVDVAAVRAEAGEILTAFLGSPLAETLRQVEIVGRELPLLLAGEDGAIFRGSVDLLYRDGDGTLVVADYKTDREADETRLVRRYRRQLELYARGVMLAAGFEEPPRAELWLLRGGRRILMHA